MHSTIGRGRRDDPGEEAGIIGRTVEEADRKQNSGAVIESVAISSRRVECVMTTHYPAAIGWRRSMLKPAVRLVTVCAGLALAAAPALAADMAMKHGEMHAGHHHKMSCYDFAWQSRAMKDCLAKPATMKEPAKKMHHPMHHEMMKKPMEKPMSKPMEK
jgi:hypothetical protein